MDEYATESTMLLDVQSSYLRRAVEDLERAHDALTKDVAQLTRSRDALVACLKQHSRVKCACFYSKEDWKELIENDERLVRIHELNSMRVVVAAAGKTPDEPFAYPIPLSKDEAFTARERKEYSELLHRTRKEELRALFDRLYGSSSDDDSRHKKTKFVDL